MTIQMEQTIRRATLGILGVLVVSSKLICTALVLASAIISLNCVYAAEIQWDEIKPGDSLHVSQSETLVVPPSRSSTGRKIDWSIPASAVFKVKSSKISGREAIDIAVAAFIQQGDFHTLTLISDEKCPEEAVLRLSAPEGKTKIRLITQASVDGCKLLVIVPTNRMAEPNLIFSSATSQTSNIKASCPQDKSQGHVLDLNVEPVMKILNH